MASIEEDLLSDEGLRLQVYDDATGKPLRKGMVLLGNPTIGIGRNCANPGISRIEALMLLANDLVERRTALQKALPWFDRLSSTRQDALLDMSFMGVRKLLTFKNMLWYCKEGNYEKAAQHILNSKWARDVKVKRANRVAHMMRTGTE